jgi:hypothetical protein
MPRVSRDKHSPILTGLYSLQFILHGASPEAGVSQHKRRECGKDLLFAVFLNEVEVVGYLQNFHF